MSRARPSVGIIAWLRAADWLDKSPDAVSPVCHGSQAMSLRTVEGSPDIRHRQGTEAPGQKFGNHCSEEQHSLRKLECPPCLPQLLFTVTAHRSAALRNVYHASPPPCHPVRGCEDSPFTEEAAEAQGGHMKTPGQQDGGHLLQGRLCKDPVHHVDP